jgi:hypothetical protein
VEHSLYGASRKTHVKIVAVGLFCAALIVGVGKFAKNTNIDLGTAPLVQAGEPVTVSGHLPTIR